MAENLRDTYKPTRFTEFMTAVDPLGITPVIAKDPVDGEDIWVVDWHDVSLLVQHYGGKIADLEKIIDGLKEDLENVPYTY